jgi:hypothetical protein
MVSESALETHLRPAVRCIPSVDAVLQARAANALDLVGTDGRPEWVAASLQSVLRQWYPYVRVVPIEALASEHGELAWYVYRDGHHHITHDTVADRKPR